MRMEPLQFHSRKQFSWIFLKINNFSEGPKNFLLALRGATLKSLKPPSWDDRCVSTHCEGISTKLTGGVAGFLVAINRTKNQDQHFAMAMNHWARVVVRTFCWQQKELFFLVAKNRDVSLGFLTPSGPTRSAASPNLCSRWGTFLFWKNWAQHNNKTSFSLSCTLTQCWKMPKTEMKEFAEYVGMISIFWQCCSNSGAF